MNLKYKKNFDSKKDTIKIAYLLIAVAFLAGIVLNLYSYHVILQINEAYSKMRATADSLKTRIINTNLVFAEVFSGTPGKDMNAVWEEIDRIRNELTEISGTQEVETTLKALEIYKNSLLDMHQAKNNTEANMQELRDKYEKDYSELSNASLKIERALKTKVDNRIATLKIIHFLVFFGLFLIYAVTVLIIFRFTKSMSEMEEESRLTSKSLDSIVNCLDSTLIVIHECQHTVSRWNISAEKFFSIRTEEISNNNLFEKVPLLAELKPFVHKVVTTKKNEELLKRRINVAGSVKTVNIKMSYVHEAEAGAIMIEDITSQEIGERQAEQERQMQIVKNMVRRLAGDFSKILASITETVAILEVTTEKENINPQSLRENVKLIENLAEKTYVMVQHINSLFKEREFKPVPCDLNLLVSHILEVCSSNFGDNIEINSELYDIQAINNVDPVSLEIALMNISENAFHAMTLMRAEGEPKEGILDVSIQKIFPDRNYRQIHPQAVASSYWIISIADNGVGIKDDSYPRIFDPFFTTKEKYKAVGLGLTVANEIVRQHKGFIEVYTKYGSGSDFSVFLPDLS